MTTIAATELCQRITRIQQQMEAEWGPQGQADVAQLEQRMLALREAKLRPRPRRQRFINLLRRLAWLLF